MTARAQARGCGPVADTLPVELTRLLGARDRAAHEAAWAGFVGAYSPLLLRVTRALGRSHDAAMDAYAFVLERLRRDDLRRLRAMRPTGAAGSPPGWCAWRGVSVSTTTGVVTAACATERPIGVRRRSPAGGWWTW